MNRSQLKKDFEETFSYQFKQGYMNKTWNSDYPGHYLDERTREKFSVWVCAWETYRDSSEQLTGEYTDAN